MEGFINSFRYAIAGLKFAVIVDRNVKFHLIVGIFVFLLSYILRISTYEFIFVIFSIFFVLITEFVNTAIEEMTNLIKKEHSREAMIAKDIAAAAVLLSAIFAVIVGYIIFTPYLTSIFLRN